MNTLGNKFLITALINLLFITANTFSLEAADLNNMLQGDYKLVVTLTCVNSSNGFNENLTRIGDGGVITSNVNGIVTFDGNGNGTYDGSALSIDPLKLNDGNAPVTPVDITGTFTYTVNTDRSYQDNKVVTLTTTGGPSQGVIKTVNNILVEGQVSPNGEMILIHDSKPNIEVITLPNESTVDRICSRTGTAMKIEGSKPKVVVVPLM